MRDRLRTIAENLQPQLVWWSHADVYSATHDVVPAPAIVDLPDLEDWKLRERRRVRRLDRIAAGRRLGAGELIRSVLSREDERRWKRLHGQISEGAAGVVVCSELDRQRLGWEDVTIVPNGYSAPSSTTIGSRSGSTLIMIALFTYEPNLDGVSFLVREVLPRVRRAHPDANLKLVGRHDGALDAFVGPGVSATGEVPDVTAELARAAVVVVPVRFGSGTRLKILEAFAHGVPVVSTTLGAEGLGVSDGVELMLADDAETFAQQVIKLLGDSECAQKIAENAYATWQEQFSSRHTIERVSQLVRSVAESSELRRAHEL